MAAHFGDDEFVLELVVVFGGAGKLLEKRNFPGFGVVALILDLLQNGRFSGCVKEAFFGGNEGGECEAGTN